MTRHIAKVVISLREMSVSTFIAIWLSNVALDTRANSLAASPVLGRGKRLAITALLRSAKTSSRRTEMTTLLRIGPIT